MNFLRMALDFIFPPVCGICGKIDAGYLCQKCKTELISSNIYFNQLDQYPDLTEGSQTRKSYIDEHFYLFSYTGIIREKILQYKFEEQAYLKNTFYEFFMNNEKLYGFLKKYDIMFTIPISSSRKRERGYNQSELIAREISKTGIIHFENKVLIKQKNNQPQSSLNKKQRIENVKNVYKVQSEPKINGKNIVLFDDIYTTGATVNECAKCLKQAGCRKIGVLTIAKDFKRKSEQAKSYAVQKMY